MRKNRMLPILGLALAIPLLIASMAFACEKTCGSKATAATTAAPADAKTADAHGCTPAQQAACKTAYKGAAAVAAGSGGASSCASKTTATAASEEAACGPECVKACCAGASAAMITYKVSGMTCMGCVKQVEAAVAKMELENLESVTVNLKESNAVLTTTGPVDAVAVAAAITKAGFPAEFNEAVPSDETEEKKEEAASSM